MKKFLKSLSSLLVFCACFLNAAAEGYVTPKQIDTIVARSVRPYLLHSCDYRTSKASAHEDHLVLEYLMFRKASDALYDELKDLSQEQVREMVHFTGTYVFQRLCSRDFWQTFKDYADKAFADRKFDYEIRHVQYAELVERFNQDYAYLMERAEAHLSEYLVMPHGIRWHKPSQEQKRLNIDQDRLPYLVVKTIQDYFPYGEFAASKAGCGAFLERLAYKFSDAREVLYKRAERGARVDSVLMDPSSFVKLAEYMSLSRGPLYVERAKYRPQVSGIKVAGGVYSGQTLDGVPDGFGELTDKKGVRYMGDFKDGKRHGVIFVESPKSGVPDTQVWYKDRLLKGAAVKSSGVMPEVPVIDGKRFGYGCLYYKSLGELKEGFFIDGNIVGRGSFTDGMRYKESGLYRDGLVMNCAIRWNEPGFWISRFYGTQRNTSSPLQKFRSGCREKISVKRNEKWEYYGESISDMAEGRTRFIYIRDKDTVVRVGNFAYGKMYGHGTIVSKRKSDKDGTVEFRSYEGSVFRNVPYGRGEVEMNFTLAPEKDRLSVTRYGVKLNEYVGDTSAVKVIVDGFFKDGKLVEGKVTMSNGTYMRGKFADGVLAEGRLVKRYSDGSYYDGECRDGRYHGYGKVVYADGSIYEGLFENGKRSCSGELVHGQSKIENRISGTCSF